MVARLGRIWLAAGLILAPAFTGAQEQPADAAAVFASLEEAWAGGDARGLVAHVGSRKVSLALPELEGGLFSRSQTELVFAQHFENTETQSFRFLDMRSPEGGPPVTAALAQRRSRRIGAGAVVQDRVLVTLVREGDLWVLAEIKVLR